MRWRNSAEQFGLTSKIFHWGLAVYLIAMLVFGTILADMKVSLSNLHLFGLHKSFGMIALALIVLRVGWIVYNRPPAPIGTADGLWAARLAKGTHLALYLCILAMPLTGWIASSASVFEMQFFNLGPIPPIAPKDPDLEKRVFAAHGVIGKILIGLIVLHLAGVVVRQYVKKDATWKRMWF